MKRLLLTTHYSSSLRTAYSVQLFLSNDSRFPYHFLLLLY